MSPSDAGGNRLLTLRRAEPGDAAMIAAIYNQGIAQGATHTSEPQPVTEIQNWFVATPFIHVAEADGLVVAFAASFPYGGRQACNGIGSLAVYVAADHRGAGVGSAIVETMLNELSVAGYRKIVTHLLPENFPSRRMLLRVGFREIGIHEKHWIVGGQLRDVLLMERHLSLDDR